jgi:hypothetical protein
MTTNVLQIAIAAAAGAAVGALISRQLRCVYAAKSPGMPDMPPFYLGFDREVAEAEVGEANAAFDALLAELAVVGLVPETISPVQLYKYCGADIKRGALLSTTHPPP